MVASFGDSQSIHSCRASYFNAMTYDYSKLKLMPDAGYSLLSANKDKHPINQVNGIRQWKHLRESVTAWAQAGEWSKNPDHVFYGYCTGVNEIEVVDIDLKVIQDIDERKSKWSDIISFLRDNIDGFDKKIAVYKTLNFGFHIVYKASNVQGNLKLAKQKDGKALIETRGVGGYAVVYPESWNGLEYHEVSHISNEERDTIIQICRYFDYHQEEVIPDNVQKKSIEPNGSRLTTWDDFNQRNTVWDVVQMDFKVVRDTRERTIIKRHGAESAHSGYIFKEKQLLYLFSTGTFYPAEKALSAFACYAYREHNGDYKKAAKELYDMGYGDRYVIESLVIEKPVFKQSDLAFPIEVLPDIAKVFVMEANRTLNNSIDYMGCTFLWCCSLLIGNRVKVEVKSGWQEACSMWLALIGQPGVGKSPAIDIMSKPLNRINGQKIREYNKRYKEWKEYQALDKEQKKKAIEVDEPVKNQFIVDDLTLEALIDLHEKVPTGVGVLKDELNGWIKDMNKYRGGGDLEAWLSSWSNKSVALVRKVSRSNYIENTFIPVMGGIQPGVLESVFTSENKANGFIDRILLSYPDLQVDCWNEAEMDENLANHYELLLQSISHLCERNTQIREDGSIVSKIVKFSAESKKLWQSIFDEITAKQNDDNINQYMKSMLPKQKSYIPRFALIFDIIDKASGNRSFLSDIQPESLSKAKLMSDYFISMSQKVKIDALESEKIKTELSGSQTPKESFTRLYRANPDINKSKAAETLGVSRQTIINWIKEIKQ